MNLPIDYENSHWTVRKAAREEYVRRQNGCCWYCLKPLDEEPINWVASFFEPMSKSFPLAFISTKLPEISYSLTSLS